MLAGYRHALNSSNSRKVLKKLCSFSISLFLYPQPITTGEAGLHPGAEHQNENHAHWQEHLPAQTHDLVA